MRPQPSDATHALSRQATEIAANFNRNVTVFSSFAEMARNVLA
jgi:hypothetical protein